ncbi:hypothetical protein AC579_9793 [Pseudocercospora musae]|uniref:Uncharacterized protein n=1 Tax=Pseudocercospora musae TaxID=113226 RepID=A0A139IV19_9PEZI|nr:hypothetical protein AC579_9793 [Pseudocercospora musae]KXT18575.1 hypothetical protein AC579_9793 [Pseudocercospora musae]
MQKSLSRVWRLQLHQRLNHPSLILDQHNTTRTIKLAKCNPNLGQRGPTWLATALGVAELLEMDISRPPYQRPYEAQTRLQTMERSHRHLEASSADLLSRVGMAVGNYEKFATLAGVKTTSAGESWIPEKSRLVVVHQHPSPKLLAAFTENRGEEFGVYYSFCDQIHPNLTRAGVGVRRYARHAATVQECVYSRSECSCRVGSVSQKRMASHLGKFRKLVLEMWAKWRRKSPE